MVSRRLIIGMVLTGALFSIITAHLYISRSVEFFDAPLPPAEPEAGQASSPENNLRGQEVRVSGEYKGPAVMYQKGVFFPDTIVIDATDNNPSCLLEIENKDTQDLIIRLGPFSEKDNWGFAYDPIPQGASLVIDPRYGMTEEFFYNRARPDATFRVLLDKKCFQ